MFVIIKVIQQWIIKVCEAVFIQFLNYVWPQTYEKVTHLYFCHTVLDFQVICHVHVELLHDPIVMLNSHVVDCVWQADKAFHFVQLLVCVLLIGQDRLLLKAHLKPSPLN